MKWVILLIGFQALGLIPINLYQDVTTLASSEENIITVRIRANYHELLVTIQNITDITGIYYSSILKDSSNVITCDSKEPICGELLPFGSHSLQISSCISDLFIYALKSTPTGSFNIKSVYTADKCRRKNATINEKCGSLTPAQCSSKYTCDLDCQLASCVDSSGTILHQLCLDKSIDESGLIARCQSYAGNQGKVRAEACQRAMPMHKIGSLGIALMAISLAVLLIIIAMVAYYNCKYSKTTGGPISICSFCPECLFPRLSRSKSKTNSEMMSQND